MSVGRLVEVEHTENGRRKLWILRRDFDEGTDWYFDYNLGYCAGREIHTTYESALARYIATRDYGTEAKPA